MGGSDMGPRSHHHVTQLATSPELLLLQGTARGCVDLLLRGTQEGSLTPHDVAWQRFPLLQPRSLWPHSLWMKHGPCSVFPPRLESMVQSVLRRAPSETWRAPSKASHKPHLRESFSLFTCPRESSRAGNWDTHQILFIPLELPNSGILCPIFSSSFKK